MIYLVSCVKGKLTAPAPAHELYQSIWFRAARVRRKTKRGVVYPVGSARTRFARPDRQAV